MPPISPTVAKLRARRARAVQLGNPDAPELARDLEAAKLEQQIERLVSTLPPLTEQQRARLALLLAPGVNRHA